MLLEHLADDAVERHGGVEVLAEGFFDNDLGVQRGAEAARGQAGGAEVAQDGGEHRGRRGDVEQHLHLAAEFLLDAVDMRGETGKRLRLVVAARDVGRVGRHVAPDVLVQLAAGKLLDRAAGDLAKLLVGDRLAAVAHEEKVGGQEVVESEVVDRGDELPGGEITGSTKDHDHRGRSAAVFAQTLQERMAGGVGHSVKVGKLRGGRCAPARLMR